MKYTRTSLLRIATPTQAKLVNAVDCPEVVRDRARAAELWSARPAGAIGHIPILQIPGNAAQSSNQCDQYRWGGATKCDHYARYLFWRGLTVEVLQECFETAAAVLV